MWSVGVSKCNFPSCLWNTVFHIEFKKIMFTVIVMQLLYSSLFHAAGLFRFIHVLYDGKEM